MQSSLYVQNLSKLQLRKLCVVLYLSPFFFPKRIHLLLTRASSRPTAYRNQLMWKAPKWQRHQRLADEQPQPGSSRRWKAPVTSRSLRTCHKRAMGRMQPRRRPSRGGGGVAAGGTRPAVAVSGIWRGYPSTGVVPRGIWSSLLFVCFEWCVLVMG
jgi:hypothetical protein